MTYRTNWRNFLQYPNHVEQWAVQTLDTAQELLEPEDDPMGDRLHAMETWLQRLIQAGLITKDEASRLRGRLSPNM